jgi:hypothetical protein
MSFAHSHLPSDRPLMRLFDPGIDSETLTMSRAHELFRQPQLLNRSKSYRQDCLRALAKWEEFERRIHELGQRITYPLPIKDVTSSYMRAFQEWLLATTTLGPSMINRMVREILTTIALAGDDGHEVRTVRCKRLPEPTGAKIYFDDLQMSQLWAACGEMQWPVKLVDKPRVGSSFCGTGLEPATWWRCVLILLRTYGMRVQDLLAYEPDKTPVTWREISFQSKTPNPHGREEWPLGWFTYRSGKMESRGGRQYYLPMTRYTRVAIDRLHAAALSRAQSLGLDAVPGDWLVVPCPRGGAVTRQWCSLCEKANVFRPIEAVSIEELGDKWLAKTTVSSKKCATREEAEQWLLDERYYVMEDFRSTVATFLSAIEESLPNKVCGWTDGNKINTGRKNYINDEPVLLKYLPSAPMPRCFDDWLD